jgi:outer membrane protein assembly factor BamB
MSGSGFGIALVGLALSVAPAAAESGTGAVGAWEVVWRYSEAEGYQNRFRELAGNDADFPVRWRRIVDGQGDRLAFFDHDGALEAERSLAPEEDGMASQDGTACLIWSDRPESGDRTFRFERRDVPGSGWEANSSGDPVLMDAKGAFFVLASRTLNRDRFQRIVEGGGGELRVVGAEGDVLGELPVYPLFSAASGDGRRILLLHGSELIAMSRDGRLEWERPVPIDQLAFRSGVLQLAAGPGIVVVCGTGPARSDGGGLHRAREGTLLAFDDDGGVLWERRQPSSEELWFQMSAAVSSDGSVVATCHARGNVLEVRAWDASGELLWTQTAVRRSGFRSLSLLEGGRWVVLAQCDNQTSVDAWDAEGTTAWSGMIPFASREARIVGDDWLVGEEWIVKLTGKSGEL